MASWISLAGAGSILTFWFVQLNPGHVDLVPGSEVGLYLHEGSVHVIVPTTFTNTSAPRIFRHVHSVLGSLEGLGATCSKPCALVWRFERKFVYAEDYKRKYPGYAQTGGVDVPAYENRAFPFSVQGGTSTAKLLDLWRPGYSAPLTVEQEVPMDRFRLTLRALTTEGPVTAVADYVCDGRSLAPEVRWCWRSVPPAAER